MVWQESAVLLLDAVVKREQQCEQILSWSGDRNHEKNNTYGSFYGKCWHSDQLVHSTDKGYSGNDVAFPLVTAVAEEGPVTSVQKL